MFLGRLILSAIVEISLKALSMARSELLMVLLFWYFELPNSSKLAAPVPYTLIHGFVSQCKRESYVVQYTDIHRNLVFQTEASLV